MNNKVLIGLGVVALGIYLYNRRNGNGTGLFSNASGTMSCTCKDKFGNYVQRDNCRKSKHEDCTSCCGHYGAQHEQNY